MTRDANGHLVSVTAPNLPVKAVSFNGVTISTSKILITNFQ